jgi:hypothetical protein
MFDDTQIDTTPPVVETPEGSTTSGLQELAQPTETVEDDQTKNFKQLRKKAEQVAKERDEALARLRDYEERIKQSSPPESESDEFTMQPDELAEGKHISKVQKQLNKLREEVRVATTEAKLKAQYPDFDSVVSKENILALRDMYPEIAQALNSSPDLYATAASAYTLIKKLGLNANAAQYDAEKKIVQANAAKPKPLASVSPQQGDSPLSRANAFANGLTDELKTQLLREMEQARRGM